MISHVTCFALTGLEGVPVTVETDVNKGVPAFEMVGLPDAAVKESKERVRSALKNSGRPQKGGRFLRSCRCGRPSEGERTARGDGA